MINSEVSPLVSTNVSSNIISDAEILYRFFLSRDEMNAEVHSTGTTNVRYSPITLAAERVLNFLYHERYKFEPGTGVSWRRASEGNAHFEEQRLERNLRPSGI